LHGHLGYISSCKFTIDSRHIITASGDTTCNLWDVTTGKILTTFTDHQSDVMTVAVTASDTNIFLSAGCDNLARLHDMRDPRSSQIFVGHTDDINCVEFFPNGLSFATASDDETCRLFDIRADREIARYKLGANSSSSANQVNTNNGGVTSISFSKSGRLLFASYEEREHVVVWDIVKSKAWTMPQDHSNRISCVSVAPDGSAIGTSSWDQTIKLYA
jgi:guanine nucleotide-binding protein G(I)/G(S)/G(T) subunit beta-1